jgi:hypothetical protein
VAWKLRLLLAVADFVPQFESVSDAAKHHRGGHLMVSFKNSAIPIFAGMLLIGGLTACDREGPMERAGEKVDRSVERAGDKVERATDK